MYGKVLASLYNREFGEKALEEWRRGICRLLQAEKIVTGTVLDLGAGTGLGAKALQEIGDFKCIGLEMSVDMALEIPLGLYQKIVIGDMRHWWTDETVPNILVGGFDTLNYLSRSDFVTFIENCPRHMSSGYLCFDVLNEVPVNWTSNRFLGQIDCSDIFIKHVVNVNGLLETRIRVQKDEAICKTIGIAIQHIFPHEFVVATLSYTGLSLIRTQKFYTENGVTKTAYLVAM